MVFQIKRLLNPKPDPQGCPLLQAASTAQDFLVSSHGVQHGMRFSVKI